MGTALQKAISLILSSDAELLNILKVTAQMSFKSSLLALLLGVPLGICLGNTIVCSPGEGLLLSSTVRVWVCPLWHAAYCFTSFSPGSALCDT